MNEKSNTFELLEPPSPESLLPDVWIEPWMAILAVLLLLGVLAYFIFKNKNKSSFDPKAARRAAHAEAKLALSQIGQISTREAAVQSSLILRKYLSIAANDPALFETHEETIFRDEAFKNFSHAAREATRSGFTRLAALKYAAEIIETPAQDIVSQASDLLETLDKNFQE